MPTSYGVPIFLFHKSISFELVTQKRDFRKKGFTSMGFFSVTALLKNRSLHRINCKEPERREQQKTKKMQARQIISKVFQDNEIVAQV